MAIDARELDAAQLRDMTRPAASRLDKVDVTTLVVPRAAVPPVVRREIRPATQETHPQRGLRNNHSAIAFSGTAAYSTA